MTNLANQAEPAMESLLAADEDTLFEQLGIRATAIQENPNLSSSFSPQVIYDEAAMGVLDDVRDYGRRIFRRCSAEGYKLFCGDDPEDEEDRKQLAEVTGISQGQFSALLASMLVGQLGLAPAIAAIIAAILIKRFLIKPGYQLACEKWKAQLPSSE
jgi:hypothetical protein